ncbi:MAG: lactonase family protein [Pirellulaceae bacterium]|nr:lactonase family protein [Pirellulaceae bacterium]
MTLMMDATALRGEELTVWLGTSSAKPSQGIYQCTLDSENGKLSESRLAAAMVGPGFLAMHPKLNVLYAVGGLDGKASVVAYSISREAGRPQLKLLNSLDIGDGGATHVSVDSTGKTLLTAQYGGGSVAVFALAPDGTLEKRTAIIEHSGGSQQVAGRQDSPHPHWTGFSPDNRFAFVPDLGLDQVVIYQHDAAGATLTPHGYGQAPLGGGPRHMRFHPNGRWIYVLNELDLSVSVFDYDGQAGTMLLRQTMPTVPKEQLIKERFSSGSELCVHPTGKFVYAANRGHDTVTAFAIDQGTGQLQVIEREPVRGAEPRNINLDPSGSWLLAAGQDSHTLASFQVNPQSGELVYNRSVIQTPAPICILFDRD